MRTKLLVLRKRARLTQAELAERIGISRVYYSMIETGSVPIKKVHKVAICQVLKCKEEDLIDVFEDRIIGGKDES